MEPITTTALLTLISYWGGKAFDKVFDTATGEFTKDSVRWLKSLFFEDDKPKEVLTKYEEKPDSPARQNAVKASIETNIEDNPKAKKYLRELLQSIEAKTGGPIIKDSKNVVTGTIHSGGSTIVGDNNQL